MIGVAFVLTGALTSSAQFTPDDELIHGKGPVKYLNFEGGFYGIVRDDGKNYNPTNMPQEFKVSGSRVRCATNIMDYVSFHMWRYVIRSVSIDRLS